MCPSRRGPGGRLGERGEWGLGGGTVSVSVTESAGPGVRSTAERNLANPAVRQGGLGGDSDSAGDAHLGSQQHLTHPDHARAEGKPCIGPTTRASAAPCWPVRGMS